MVLAIGGSHFVACKALDFAMKNSHHFDEILVCKSLRDTGEDGWQRSLSKLARVSGVELVNLDELYDIENLIFFSLEYDLIIKPSKFLSKELFNIHFSLLPKYKGMYTSCIPLLNGDTRSGVTLHRIDEGIDTGNILAQNSFDIPIMMNSFELFSKYHDEAFKLFQENLFSILKREYTEVAQEGLNSSYNSKNSINFSNISIDLKKTAFEIHNQIRGFRFRPFQIPTINDKKISHTQITASRSSGKPGSIILINNHHFIINTIDYQLDVYIDLFDEIFLAILNEDIQFLEYCYNLGYSLSEQNDKGWNPLIVASYNERFETLEYLLKKGFDPNIPNYQGTTPLMYSMTAASKSNRLDGISILLKYGADPFQSDHLGVSLIEYANKCGNLNVIEFLTNLKIIK